MPPSGASADCEPQSNALPTLCFDRAREHAKRLMRGQEAARPRRTRLARGTARRHQGPDRRRRRAHDLRLADLQGSRAGSVASGRRAHRGQGRHRHRQVEHARVRRRRLDVQRGVRAHDQSLEHGADLRRLDRRRCGGAGRRRGVAGPGHGSCRQPAAAGDLLLRRRPASVARPRDARCAQQSVCAAVGAGSDGAQRPRPGAVPRCDGGLLPARSPHLRRAGRFVLRGGRRARASQAHRVHGGLRRQDPDGRRDARDLPQGGAPLRGTGRRRGGGERPTSAPWRRRFWCCARRRSWSIARSSSRRTAISSRPTSSGTPSRA